MIASSKTLAITGAIGFVLTATVASTILWGPSNFLLSATCAAEPAPLPAALKLSPPEILQLSEHSFSKRIAYFGAGSCSSANCHGAAHSNSGYATGSEYSIWIQEDPHAQAFATLYSSKSLSIVLKLAAGKTDQIVTPPYRDKTCLACHTTRASRLTVDNRFTIHDGVSCESCHGAAEKWLEPHKWDSWNDKEVWSKEEKANIGFNDTSDLLIRAKTCVECHVGSPGRDVNHDLIAAGHPRLYFELSAYLARMPQHWSREKDLRKNSSSLEARLWVIGQITSADAAMELLAERASNSRKPWPEFAEYHCFACHQDLVEPTRSEKRRRSITAKVKFPWGTWHTPMLNIAINNSENAMPGLQELNSAMDALFSDRKQVQKCAIALKGQLSEIATALTDKKFSMSEVEATIRHLSAPEFLIEESSWDANVQRYLAIVALRQAMEDILRDQEKPTPDWMTPMGQELKKIRNMLEFPTGGTSQQYDSPRSFTGQWETIRESYGNIHSHLETP